jgi:tRNA pseudouridine38/39 synthase
MTTNPRAADYNNWSREQLIDRLITLEGSKPVNARVPTISDEIQHVDNGPTISPPSPFKQVFSTKSKDFNFASHPKRKVTLKFCYSGWEYGGLAYQTGVTQLPTVEGVLFEALAKARLIEPSEGMEGCGWEKCGRTDRGVSAAGQVISLWVRSAIDRSEGTTPEENMEGKSEEKTEKQDENIADVPGDSGLPGLGEEDFGTLDLSRSSSPIPTSEKHFASSSTAGSKPKNELDYIAILNRILPPTIRILAWAPVSPSFSARFSCKYRHYKYFFSSYSLNIPAMREAATTLLGEHDFRNLCKVDAQKQITVFKRIISRANIEPVDQNIVDSGGERREGMFVFNLVGSAFLYHQVRHIMAILFLIGTGLEKPSLMTKLMNVVQGAELLSASAADGEELETTDRKPEYQMADGLPLMLWDCGYAEEDVKWRTGSLELTSDSHSPSDGDTRRSGQGTKTDLYHQLHSTWNRSCVYTVLDRHLLQAAERYHQPPQSVLPLPPSSTIPTPDLIQDYGMPVNYPLGGGSYKRVLKYVPVLKRNRLDTVEAINERWRLGKGSRRAERRTESGCGNDVEE